MTILSVEQIAAADDLGTEILKVPEWAGEVKVRGLGYGEWVDVRDASIVAGQQDERLLARLLFAAALVEPDVTPEQAEVLVNKSASAVNRLMEAITRLSGNSPEAFTEAEAGFPG